MTERKRLTTNEKYPHGAEGVSKNKLTGRYCRGVFEATACIEKLAEYETAEEEGKLVILPCKPGDTVYIIREDCDFPHDCYQSRTCNKCEYRSLYVDEEVFSLVDIVKNLRLFGIIIFLIHEKAEKALEEMNKDE